MRGVVPLLLVACSVSAAPAQTPLTIGKTYEGLKLLSVNDGASVVHMAKQLDCPELQEFDRYTRQIAEEAQGRTQEVRIVSRFVIRDDGTPDSVRVTLLSYPALKNVFLSYARSCRYQPAVTAEGTPVTIGVERTIRITFEGRQM